MVTLGTAGGCGKGAAAAAVGAAGVDIGNGLKEEKRQVLSVCVGEDAEEKSNRCVPPLLRFVDCLDY